MLLSIIRMALVNIGQGSIGFGSLLQDDLRCRTIGFRIKLVEPCILGLELGALTVLIGLGLFERKATGGQSGWLISNSIWALILCSERALAHR